ncbi:MAG: hypothetical protein DRG59_01580 [Deltaproteobacteria bacterium]|nr:MAG: hypothetical protein DRG59_01580 [Deltaproteobacteria bacterium]
MPQKVFITYCHVFPSGSKIRKRITAFKRMGRYTWLLQRKNNSVSYVSMKKSLSNQELSDRNRELADLTSV